MNIHFKKSGHIMAALLTAMLACAVNRAQAQAIVTGMSNSFGVLASSSVSASNAVGTVTGDVGVDPGSAITLNGTTVVGGGIFRAIEPAVTGHTDAQTAYNQMAGLAIPTGEFHNGNLTSLDLGALGQALTPGVYFFNSSAGLTGTLVLSGQGQYVFKIGSTLTTASGANIILTNGADASNVFFQVGSSATLGTGTNFQGSIYSLASDTVTTGSVVNGHVVAVTGAVTLDGDTITTTTNLIVNATVFDLGAARNEPVSVVTLSNAGSILGSGTSELINTGNYNLQDGIVTAILSGNGSVLNKTTNGTVTLSGANTYTGGTTISAGTLAVTNVSGSATGTGAVTVNSGATLTGSGAVGNTTISSGGILAPGSNGVGNLTLSTLTLASNSITNLEFNGTANDQLFVTGNNGLTLGNGAILDIYQANTTTAFITPGTYQLIGFVGNETGAPSNLTIGTSTGGLNFNLSTSGNFVDLTIALATGPGSWSATGSGNWSNTSDWTSGIVGAGIGNTAVFGSSITAPATVTLDGNETVGGITFGNANSYTIAPGTGFLTLNNSGAASVIAVSLGNDTISSPIILTAGGASAQVSAGSTLTLSGVISQNATAGLTKGGLGTLILSALNTYTGPTTVTGGTLTDGISGAIPSVSNLTVNGTTAIFNLGANQTNTVGNVTLDGNGSIIGTGNSTLTSTGGFQLMNGTVTAIMAGNGSALNKTTNGTVTLSALNTYTGPTTVTAGTLTDGISGAIPSVSNLSVNGTTAIFNLGANHTNTVGNVTLDGNGSITGTGGSTLTSTGGFQLMNGTVTAILAGNGSALNKTTNGTVTLAGANTYTGNTTISAGTLILSPTGSLANTSVVNLAAGAVLTVDQNGTIATLNSSGTINGNSTLTATNYNLNNSTLVNTPLGNGTVATNGNVSINSTIAGSNDTIDTGTLTVQQPGLLSPNATVTVTNGTTLVLANGDNTILALTGNGTVDGANGVLTVTDGFGNFTGTVIGATATNGTLTSSGNLTIPTGTTDTYANGTFVTGGTLTVNGTLVSSNVTVDTAGTLSGLGTIAGNVINNGIVSPSDPSIMHISGNFNENGTLDIEIGGTGGPGVNPNGHDQIVVGGFTTINPAGSVLNLQSVNGFTSPARGDTFKFINGAPNSISGHFGSITSNFTTDLLIDLHDGEAIGTGTPRGSSLATNFPGATPGELATLNQYQVAPDQFEGGDLIHLLLTNPSSATSQIFNQSSPEAYAGFSDYSLRSTQAYLNTALTLDPLVASGKYEVFAGYNYYNGGSDSSQSQADYNLESNGGVLGVRVAITPQIFLGAFLGIDSGSVKSTYLNSSDVGEVGGVYVTYDPLASHRLLTTASFTYGNFSTHGTRSTFSGASNFSGVGSNDYLGSFDVQYVAIQEHDYSITPDVTVSYSNAGVDSFTESNPVAVEALHVNAQNTDSFRTEVAVNGMYNITSQIGLTSRFGISHDFLNTSRNVNATVVSDGTAVSSQAPGMGDTDYNVGIGAFYTPIPHLRLQINYTAGFSTQAKMSNTFSVGGSYSW